MGTLSAIIITDNLSIVEGFVKFRKVGRNGRLLGFEHIKIDFSSNGFNDFILLTCYGLDPPNIIRYLHINIRKDKLCMVHMLIHATSKPYPCVLTKTCDCVINDQ